MGQLIANASSSAQRRYTDNNINLEYEGGALGGRIEGHLGIKNGNPPGADSIQTT